MIRFVAALDDKRGIAVNGNLPWRRSIPGDMRWFRKLTLGKAVLMGMGTLKTLRRPLTGRTNYVVARPGTTLPENTTSVTDVTGFMRSFPDDLWVIGGAEVFARTIREADELYLTRVAGDFHCTVFFPEFEADFARISRSHMHIENGVEYHFEIWRRK